ncbi:MAG: PHP domain-containing protein [Clostridia bacterium]|nr:PHP domain-containing protein [Clostridia bacterium]
MFLTGDYHTHTVYSHGKGSVLDNALKAKERGLKELGITDHGFSHPAFGLRKNKLESLRKDCDYATKNTGVKVLMGIESNVTSTDGRVDLRPELYDQFDLFLAGVHKFIAYKFKSVFTMSLPNLFYSTLNSKNVPESLVKSNTRAIINVIKNNPVDVITHLNFCYFAEPVEIAKAAADYGTYLELNAKKTHLRDEQLFAISKTGVKFIIDSDAHSPDRVAEIALVNQLLSRVKIPEERIVNINGKLPDFRFRAFKEGR